ncbi:MAG: hypothetical protein IJZ50_05930 [Alistipes sp.]|nr:hypothetical protein [Alistipes sp.]MBQ8775369.1 hypothetical protein [Alistipes sp.]
MIVKKKNLIIVCIVVSISVIVASIAISAYVRKASEEREKQELMNKFNRAVDREYKDLEREYNSIVDVIKDYDYSDSFRWKYIIKLSDLVDDYEYRRVYADYGVSSVLSRIRSNKEKDMTTLKTKAQIKVLYGEDD